MKLFDRLKKMYSSQEGAIAVIVALSMVVLMASAALTLDLGMAYHKTSKLQNAMDSAVLAAAQELPAGSTSSAEWTAACDAATQYAHANGVDAVTIAAITKYGKIMGIHASSETEVEYTFARAIGKESGDISRSAAAEKQPVSGMSGVVPLSAWSTLMTSGGGITTGEAITLKVGKDGQKEYPGSGWFGALSLGGSGASNYKDNLINGYDGDVTYGSIITTENGNMSGPTISGFDERISGHELCTYASHESDCPRIVIVPIVDAFDASGHFKVKVLGFAAFFLEDMTDEAGKAVITARYIDEITVSGGASTNASAEDYGVYAVKLTE